MSNDLNITMLQEMGDAAYFRLPDLGIRLPKSLRGGRVMSAGKIAKMVMYSIMVLKAADEDVAAATNEFRMAKHAPNENARRHHTQRCEVLGEQARMRHVFGSKTGCRVDGGGFVRSNPICNEEDHPMIPGGLLH